MVSSSLFWDTCVLYRWLNGSPEDYLDHIKKYLEEASSGHVSIFISTISLAEISKSLTLIDTSPAIMSLAGYLRDQSYRHIEGPDKAAPSRLLGIGDAIQLATAVALREEFGVQNLTLHTFDEGKRRDSLESKKSVPIIGFEKWCRDCVDDEEVQKIISLPRKKPEHIACPLPQKHPPTAST